MSQRDKNVFIYLLAHFLYSKVCKRRKIKTLDIFEISGIESCNICSYTVCNGNHGSDRKISW